MTEIKIIPLPNNHSVRNWFVPALWMRGDCISFDHRIVKINGIIYREYSEEFNKAFEADRLFRILQQ